MSVEGVRLFAATTTLLRGEETARYVGSSLTKTWSYIPRRRWRGNYVK